MLDMLTVITVYPFLAQKPHIPLPVFLDMVYFLGVQTVFQTYVLINLPSTGKTNKKNNKKKNKPGIKIYFHTCHNIFRN